MGWLGVIGFNGAPDRIRTCDLCLRRAALYPAELRVPLRRCRHELSQPTLRRRGFQASLQRRQIRLIAVFGDALTAGGFNHKLLIWVRLRGQTGFQRASRRGC